MKANPSPAYLTSAAEIENEKDVLKDATEAVALSARWTLFVYIPLPMPYTFPLAPGVSSNSNPEEMRASSIRLMLPSPAVKLPKVALATSCPLTVEECRRVDIVRREKTQ